MEIRMESRRKFLRRVTHNHVFLRSKAAECNQIIRWGNELRDNLYVQSSVHAELLITTSRASSICADPEG
jgi:hypothetical protein